MGNGGQSDNSGEATIQNESSEVSDERLAKLLDEKMQNNGTRNEAGMYNFFIFFSMILNYVRHWHMISFYGKNLSIESKGKPIYFCTLKYL